MKRAFISLLALAVAAVAAPAQADTYDFDLSGVVADGAHDTAPGIKFYTLDLLPQSTGDIGMMSAGFDPIALQVGDVFNLTVTLNTLLNVPASNLTFFGVDFLTDYPHLPASDGGPVSSSSVTLLDGSLAGDTYYSACSNCLAGSFLLAPGPAFDVSRFLANITIDNLTSLDPDNDSTFYVYGFQLRYQVSTDGGFNPNPGAVPEPATWAMMIAGFGLAGAGLRRRRASLTPA